MRTCTSPRESDLFGAGEEPNMTRCSFRKLTSRTMLWLFPAAAVAAIQCRIPGTSSGPGQARRSSADTCDIPSLDTLTWRRTLTRDNRIMLLLPPDATELDVPEGQTWRTDSYSVNYQVLVRPSSLDTVLGDEVVCIDSFGAFSARLFLWYSSEGGQFVNGSWTASPDSIFRIAGHARDSSWVRALVTVVRSARRSPSVR